MKTSDAEFDRKGSIELGYVEDILSIPWNSFAVAVGDASSVLSHNNDGCSSSVHAALHSRALPASSELEQLFK